MKENRSNPTSILPRAHEWWPLWWDKLFESLLGSKKTIICNSPLVTKKCPYYHHMVWKSLKMPEKCLCDTAFSHLVVVTCHSSVPLVCPHMVTAFICCFLLHLWAIITPCLVSSKPKLHNTLMMITDSTKGETNKDGGQWKKSERSAVSMMLMNWSSMPFQGEKHNLFLLATMPFVYMILWGPLSSRGICISKLILSM